jgi:hypothetical protein
MKGLARRVSPFLSSERQRVDRMRKKCPYAGELAKTGLCMPRSFLNAIRCILMVSVLALLPAATSAGTPVTYTDAGRALFMVEVPDFWSLRTGGLRDLAGPEADDIRDVSRVFGMTPDAHQGIWVGVISPHGVATLQEAADYLRDIGPFLVKNATVGVPEPRRVGGLPARSIKGQGTRDGKPVDFTVLAMDLPGARVAIAVVVIEVGADLEPLGDINRMLGSIRAVGGGG